MAAGASAPSPASASATMAGISFKVSGRRTRRSVARRGWSSTGLAEDSAPVVGIDLDVAMGEVAGPHRGLAPSDADIDRNHDLAPFHVARDRRLVIALDALALVADGDAADGDAHPIGIRAGECRLDQRRIGDREADAARGARRRGTGHLDGDEFLRPLAVAHNLLCQIGEHLVERLLEGAGADAARR